MSSKRFEYSHTRWLASLVLLAAATSAPAQKAQDTRAAVEALPGLRSHVLDGLGRPLSLEADLGSYDESRSESDLRALGERLGPLYGAAPDRFVLEAESSGTDQSGARYVRLRQRVLGLPVFQLGLTIRLADDAGAIDLVNGQLLGTSNLPTKPALDALSALQPIGQRRAGVAAYRIVDDPQLGYALARDGSAHLVWAATFEYPDGAELQPRERLLVEALDGSLFAVEPLATDARNRETWLLNHSPNPSGGTLVYREQDNPKPKFPAAAAHYYMSLAWDYFFNRFGRDSYDNHGHLVHSAVQLGTNYNNAGYYYTQEVFGFGDGDGVTYGPFSYGRDVVAHEFTHGLTHHSPADLVYRSESGALNESISDVFGAAVEASDTGVRPETWLVGEDVYTPGHSGDAFRYMNDPRRDGTSKDDYRNLQFNGVNECGVHYNSGVSNLAFYLLSQGGTHPRGVTTVAVPSIGIEKAARVFYTALAGGYMQPTETFAAARQHTAQAASALYGAGSSERVAVCKAWDAVRVPGKDCGSCGGAACVAPAAPATLNSRNNCFGDNEMTWSAAPGASYYRIHVGFTAQNSDFECPLLSSTYYGTSGSLTIPQSMNGFIARIQACNDQGCSPLSSDTAIVRYKPICN